MTFHNIPQLVSLLAGYLAPFIKAKTMNNSKYSHTFVSYHLQNKAVYGGNPIKQTLAGARI